MRFRLHISLLILTVISVSRMSPAEAQEWKSGVEWQEPPIVTPGATSAAPPSDAVVLFDGSSLDAWENGEKWLVQDGVAIPRETAISSKQHFGDLQLHLEWSAPTEIRGEGQGRGNSGCYLMGLYEVQILDSFGLAGEFNECGSLYRQTPPDVNMCLPPLVWQTYDIIFTAARFDPETKAKTSPARITVYHNGVAVHDDRQLPSKTGAGQPEGPTPNPILFQNHSDPVRFRNVWFVERTADDPTPSLDELIAASAPPVTELAISGCGDCRRWTRIGWRWRRWCR